MRKLIELASWTVLALVGQTTVLSGRAEDLSVRAKDLSSEEESLVEQGKMMEAYRPNEHSGHHIEEIRVQGQSQWSRVVTFIFGIEDATGARAEGKSMAEFQYTRPTAEKFIFAEGWDKYHDRFFTRCYMKEAQDAYDAAIKRQ